MQCGGRLCDCQADGDIDLFDVLFKIDIVLEKAMPTEVQRALCDDDCDGKIDIFDVLREIDHLLERTPCPEVCPVHPAAAVTGGGVRRGRGAGGGAGGRGGGGRGGGGVLRNGGPVRGVELTLMPTGGAVEVVGVEPTARTRGFEVAYHQARPGAPVKVAVVSLEGRSIPPGRGTIVRVKTAPGGARTRLRVAEAKIAQELSSDGGVQ